MRLATVVYQGSTRAAVVEDGYVSLLPYAELGELLSAGPVSAAAGQTVAEAGLAEIRLAAPVPRPEKIICVGLNFRDHAAEAGFALPGSPTLFAKYWRSLVGPNDEIELPAVSSEGDWEAELAVVIGRPCRHASEREASEAIAGYTVLNDISMRDWQMRTPQFLQGKTFENSTPVGPYLVTPDDVPDPAGLDMSCHVNGEQMQRSSTAEMIFSPAEIIAYISQVITLV